ncbi:MAG: hypothetical protein Q8Q14_14320, partial [Gemmatimonadales bacterium]|nr:hypothetical protein [Gemmatimonadales bacterium]
QLNALLPPLAAAAAAAALSAAIVARARTEQRAEPRGWRRIRFWRGPLGRAVFRLAAVGVRPTGPASAVATVRAVEGGAG